MNKLWLLMDEQRRWYCGIYADLNQAKADAEATYRRDMLSIYSTSQNVTVEAEWEKHGTRLLIMVGVVDWDFQEIHHQTRFPVYVLVSFPLDKRAEIGMMHIGKKIGEVFNREREKGKANL